MEERVEIEIRRCKRVIDRIRKLPLCTSINHSCTRTLLKLAHSELSFLSRSRHQSSLPLSVNIGHLEAVIHLLEQPFVSGVSRVCKPIRTTHFPSKTVHVDIVCSFNKNPVWIIVSDRNPKYISWHDGFKLRIERLLLEARSSEMIIKPSSILVFFARRIDDFVLEKLKVEFGAFEIGLEFDLVEDLEDEWINVIDTPYQDSIFIEMKVDGTSTCDAVSNLDCVSTENFNGQQEDDTTVLLLDSFSSLISGFRNGGDLVNFDTTALIAIVSGISNGCAEKLLATPEIKLRQRFKGNFEFVVAQNPIHAELADATCGKRGIICESVLSEFKELVSMCGGPNEKLRADKILKLLVVVPDSPSERMMCLPTTRKLALKNKVVFGTGDHWRAPTLTANMAFVRAVSQTGMSLFTIEHRPRALTGD